jgi:hypothetical protein
MIRDSIVSVVLVVQWPEKKTGKENSIAGLNIGKNGKGFFGGYGKKKPERSARPVANGSDLGISTLGRIFFNGGMTGRDQYQSGGRREGSKLSYQMKTIKNGKPKTPAA